MKPVRIIHTGDVHLDTSFSGSGLPPDKGSAKREKIRESFRKIVDYARERGAAALVIAGDLYESDRVTLDTRALLRELFRSIAPAPVVIAPGNHDPAGVRSPYLVDDWPDNVYIFREQTCTVIEPPGCPVAFVGYGFTKPHVETSLMSTIPLVAGDRPVVLVAHGSQQNVETPEGVYAPFNPDELRGRGITYAALGHEHRFRCVLQRDPPAFYTGVPEPRGFDETGGQFFIEVEIGEGGVRVDRRPSGLVLYRDYEIDCTGFSTHDQIIADVGELAQDDLILRVTLAGRPAEDMDIDMQAIAQRLSERFFHLELIDRTEPPYDFDALARENTVRGRFVAAMLERIADVDAEDLASAERALRLGVEAFREGRGDLG